MACVRTQLPPLPHVFMAARCVPGPDHTIFSQPPWTAAPPAAMPCWGAIDRPRHALFRDLRRNLQPDRMLCSHAERIPPFPWWPSRKMRRNRFWASWLCRLPTPLLHSTVDRLSVSCLDCRTWRCDGRSELAQHDLNRCLATLHAWRGVQVQHSHSQGRQPNGRPRG